jgi:3-methyl-2-oxobutanoate hydroxymethyltransferase
MQEVRDRTYPGPEQTVYMPEDELKKFEEVVGWQRRR